MNGLVTLVRGNLSKIARLVLGALIVIEVRRYLDIVLLDAHEYLLNFTISFDPCNSMHFGCSI